MKFYKRNWDEAQIIQDVIRDEVNKAKTCYYGEVMDLEQKVNKLTEILGIVVNNMPEEFQKTIALELGYYAQ